MSYSRYYWYFWVKNSSCYYFFIKWPKFFYRASTSSNNYSINIFKIIKKFNSFTYILSWINSLNRYRIKFYIYFRISSLYNINNISYNCTSLRCNYTNRFWYLRYWFFISCRGYFFAIMASGLWRFNSSTFPVNFWPAI